MRKIGIFFVVFMLVFSGCLFSASSISINKKPIDSNDKEVTKEDGWFDSVEVGKIEMDFISRFNSDDSYTHVTGGAVEVTPRTMIKIPIFWSAINKRSLQDIYLDLDAKVKLFKASWHLDLDLEPGDSAEGEAYLSFRAPKENGVYDYTIWAECDYDSEDSAPLTVTVKGESTGKIKLVHNDFNPIILKIFQILGKQDFFFLF